MTQPIIRALAALAPLLFFAAAPSLLSAAVVTQPAGLNPGDPYRLAFVTGFGGTHDALSSDVTVYNNFISGLAAGVPELSALGTTWTAIASTASVDARDNTSTNGVGVPMYRLDGLRIATGDADMWDGSLENALQVDHNGNLYFGQVWTGTQTDGTASAGLTLGETSAIAASAHLLGATWIDSGSLETDPIDSDPTAISFYAISGVLFAQATAVPEPATWGLALVGLVALCALARRRRS